MNQLEVSPVNVIQLPSRLIENISAGRCVLFLGAGISLDSGAPSSIALSNEIAEQFLDIPAAGYPLSEVAALVDAEDGRRRLNDWIMRRLSALRPSVAIHALPLFRWQAIYTTNFDTLVEAAYKETPNAVQRLHPIYSNRDPISTLETDEVAFYKLHGCISRANSEEANLVLTQDDFARAEDGRQRLFNRLVDHVVDLPVLYIGFARADPDFARVLATVEKAVGSLSGLSRSYALQPGHLDAEIKRAAIKKVTLLNMGAEDFFSKLDATITLEQRNQSEGKEASEVHSRVTLRRNTITNNVIVGLTNDYEILDDALDSEDTDPETFFKGSVPLWGDIAAGVDAHRDVQDTLLEALLVDIDLDKASPTLVVLHAEAGAGKSTLLRRVGAELVTTWDSVVLYLRPFGALDFLDIERLTSAIDERIYILVDDATRIAVELRTFLDAARHARAKVTIFAAARTNEWRESQEAQLLIPHNEFELESLTLTEIDHILDTLAQHGQLGYLEDADRKTQHEAFESRAQKQLLVALREATEGKAFDEIVVDEFERIPSEDAKRGYLYVAALHRLRIPLAELAERVFLPATKIVLAQELSHDPEPYYGTRHPLIAEIVFDRKVSSERDRLAFYVSLIRELDLGYASDADTYRLLSRSLNRSLLRDFRLPENKRTLMREIQELDPDDAFVHQHAAMMELSFGDLRVAADHISKAIEARPNDVTIRDTEGRIVLAGVDRETTLPRKLAKLSEAQSIFTKNVSKRPTEPYGYRHLAETFWKRAKIESSQTDKARFLTETYRVLNEGLDEAINTTMLMQYRAEIENESGNRSEARQILVAALRERPDDVRMRLMAARFARLDGDTDNEIAILRTGVSVTPDAWELHYDLASAMAASQQGESDEIGRHFASALLAPARKYQPRLAYGAWLFSKGEYKKATEQFNRLESLDVRGHERFYPRTFPFECLGGRHSGRITLLSYKSGRVEYDGGATRIFFRTIELHGRRSIRMGTIVNYELAFNLLGPVARRLQLS
jgi:tetratricopeptide (TPR) repeat protein